MTACHDGRPAASDCACFAELAQDATRIGGIGNRGCHRLECPVGVVDPDHRVACAKLSEHSRQARRDDRTPSSRYSSTFAGTTSRIGAAPGSETERSGVGRRDELGHLADRASSEARTRPPRSRVRGDAVELLEEVAVARDHEAVADEPVVGGQLACQLEQAE